VKLSDQGVRFLPPAWLFVPQADAALRVVDLAHGESFDIQGELRRGLLEGLPASREVLGRMAAFNALIQRFITDYDTAPSVPLTRSALLRGAGFEHLFIELTNQCNERCAHCYADASPERHEMLAWETLEQVLLDARELGFRTIQLTGGDPLLSPHCGRAALRVRELGFERLEVYTNGLALTDAVYAPLQRARAEFAFSFYSSDPRVHDEVTQTPGSQQRTLAAIRRVLADGLRVRASIVVTAANRHTVEDTYALLRAEGVPPASIASDQEREVGRGQYQADVTWGQPSSHDYGAARRQVRAFAGKASISGDGTVYPCIFSRKLPLGNVTRQRLRDVLGGDSEFAPSHARTALGRADALSYQLSCWECRLRSVLLAPEPELVTLRTRRTAAR
jgi:MoaA/NifB/PqqE/SkfB family radical SAM enzyme